ncbi:hypothetical protein [Paracoccus sp. S1E-3]|uniref:hypothetical protein n=1 Tax=Paracoccus sp. S1E-3 TaxID=2756130 RepID=UPI0015EEFE20|nr:hypothetical protein [Paracoccus sp. S1E-3]MBA4491579.1 hypothetical protein [Paracoccus sp. S1E-3]
MKIEIILAVSPSEIGAETEVPDGRHETAGIGYRSDERASGAGRRLPLDRTCNIKAARNAGMAQLSECQSG